MGTTSKFICVCNFGYEGEKCEKETKKPIITLKPIDFELTTKASQIDITKTTLNNLESKTQNSFDLQNQENDNKLELLNERKSNNKFSEEKGESFSRNFHKYNRRK